VEHRFESHKHGYKSAWTVKKYGIRLLSDFYEHLNPMPFGAAARMEKDLAEDLRVQGCTVTGGTQAERSGDGQAGSVARSAQHNHRERKTSLIRHSTSRVRRPRPSFFTFSWMSSITKLSAVSITRPVV
jgi:hypothetical protein